MHFFDLPALVIAQLLILGAGTGVLAGLLGIGGGMILVPFVSMILTGLGAPHPLAVKMAIASSMATILFTSLSSVRAHHRRGFVHWDLVRTLSPGIVGGGLVAGASMLSLLKGQWLALIFALFVGYSATKMLRMPRALSARVMPGRLGQAAAGSWIGFVSGLVGAGGGFISVPWMTRRGVTMHGAVATSAALGFPIALANTVGYALGGASLPASIPGAFGYLHVPAILLISIGSVTTAPIGARMAHALDVAQLRRVFAALLYCLAAYMLVKAVAAPG